MAGIPCSVKAAPGNALWGLNRTVVPQSLCCTRAAELAATRTRALGLLRVRVTFGVGTAAQLFNQGWHQRTTLAASPVKRTCNRMPADERLIRCCTKKTPFISLLPASIVWRAVYWANHSTNLGAGPVRTSVAYLNARPTLKRSSATVSG